MTEATTKEQRREALEVAISRAGGIVAFARAMGVAHQTVTYWRKRSAVPLPRAAAIETLYGVDKRYLIQPELAAAISGGPVSDVL